MTQVIELGIRHLTDPAKGADEIRCNARRGFKAVAVIEDAATACTRERREALPLPAVG